MQLEVGKSYKIKFDFNKTKKTVLFEGEFTIEEGQTKALKFKQCTSTLYAYNEMIESIEEVKAKKVKAKEEKVCPRCHGMKVFEHMKHVDGGICFKCKGTGVNIKEIF